MTLHFTPISAAFDPVFDVDTHAGTRLGMAPKLPTPAFDPRGKWAGMTADARTAAVRAGSAERKSARMIAFDLGTTKNAVCGVAFRNKIPLYGDPLRQSELAPFPAELRVSADAWTPAGTPLTFGAATDADACMWPVGDLNVPAREQLFCGSARHTGRYCEHHARRSRPKRPPDPEKLPFVSFRTPMETTMPSEMDTTIEDAVVGLVVNARKEE